MGVLKAVLILSISLGLLASAVAIFSQIHCRQKFWGQGFKAITSKLIKEELRIYHSCDGFLVSSQQKSRSLRFSLSVQLGEGI